ncbi:MAG: AMP-binding protein [Candidatus Omnitrophota bacterium]
MKEELVIHKRFDFLASSLSDKKIMRIRKEDIWHEFTYQQIQELSFKIGAFLIKEGYQKAERCALILENCPQWAMIYLGIIRAGMVCVPLDPQLSRQEINNLVTDSSCKVIFCSEKLFSDKIKYCMGVLQNDRIDGSVKPVVLGAENIKENNVVDFSAISGITAQGVIWPEVSSEDTASLIYTSGTTALPKGVLLSHKNICSDFLSIDKMKLCLPSDNILSILPLYHVYAFMVTLIVPLLLGIKITYCASFKPHELAEIIKQAGVTLLVGVPQLFSMLYRAIEEKTEKIPFALRFLIMPVIKAKARANLSSLRLMVSGGARLAPKTAKGLTSFGFKLIEGYGLTETSPVVTLSPLQKVKLGSVGKPIPDVLIKIFNPDAAGIGEVLIKGNNVMQGYFKQPELTQQVIKDGWFYSGDLGYIDNEGYLFLVGREKEVIVLASGKNIYPEELEEYYSQLPSVKEMCVLAKEDESFGQVKEVLHAVIVPDLEYFSQTQETDIRGKIHWQMENLAKGMPSYKHIMGWTLTKEELPRTVLKKIKRYEVKKKYLEGKTEVVQVKEAAITEEELAGLDEEVVKKVIGYVSKQINPNFALKKFARRADRLNPDGFNRDHRGNPDKISNTKCGIKIPVNLDSHLEIDLGIDSLTRVELGLGLEALFKIKIPDELLYKISIIRDAVMIIQDIINSSENIPENPQSQKNGWKGIVKQLPSEDILEKISLKAGFWAGMFNFILKTGFFIIFKIFWRLKIRGKDNLPAKGAFLICSNHASYLDGFIVFTSLPFNKALNTFFLGTTRILEHSSVRWGAKIARLISIDPNLYLTKALQAVSFVLLQGKIACIFPEGRRSIDEKIGEFKKGVGILVKELDVPVVPVYIKGSHKAWPRGNRFPKLCKLEIVFGKPVSLEELLKRKKQDVTMDDYKFIAQELRGEVINLSLLCHCEDPDVTSGDEAIFRR